MKNILYIVIQLENAINHMEQKLSRHLPIEEKKELEQKKREYEQSVMTIMEAVDISGKGFD